MPYHFLSVPRNTFHNIMFTQIGGRRVVCIICCIHRSLNVIQMFQVKDRFERAKIRLETFTRICLRIDVLVCKATVYVQV